MPIDLVVIASLLIGATPAAIFEALADGARFPEWDRPPRQAFVVTAAQPPSRLTMAATSWLGLQTTVRTFELAPTEDYRTRVTATERIDGPFGFLAPPAAERQAALQAFLGALKRRTSLP